jgi:hypothetical protein
MIQTELRELHGARPFVSFTVHLADGRSFPVPHSEFMALDPEGGNALLYKLHGGFMVLHLDQVTSLETSLEPASRRKRRK